jgi:uncharacterized protein involved in oxidation of intracellular sulfur
MKILFILNDAPYGSEKLYNALRLAMKLQQEHADTEIRIFLMADAVTAALPAQTTPQGYYNIERMLKAGQQRRAGQSLRHLCGGARGRETQPGGGRGDQYHERVGAVGGRIRESAHVLTPQSLAM